MDTNQHEYRNKKVFFCQIIPRTKGILFLSYFSPEKLYKSLKKIRVYSCPFVVQI